MNVAASWNWSCPFCGTRDAQCHQWDCSGFTPEAIKMREAVGNHNFGKRQCDPAADTDSKP